MKYQIRVRWLAERDLEETEDWYDEQRPGLGAEFRQTIADLFGRLAANPQIYPQVHGEVHRAVLRRSPISFTFSSKTRRSSSWRC